MYYDLAKLEQEIKDSEVFSQNLRTSDPELWAENLEAKVSAQMNALGIGALSADYSANINVSNNIASNAAVNGTSNTKLRTPGTGNGAKTWNFLVVEHNFTPEGAAGVIGNLIQESGIDPTKSQHGGGPGRGIMQWTVNERWASLLKWAEKTGKNANELMTQLEYMIIEMKQTRYKKTPVYNHFQSIKDIRAATLLFEITMERAGKPMMENRYKYAEDAYDRYLNWSVDSKGNTQFKGRALDYWEEKYG